MSRDEKPECLEKGEIMPITDDQFPGNCGINAKRVDQQVGPWGNYTVVVHSTPAEFLEVREFQKTSRERHKSAPYLTLKNNKKTLKCLVFSSIVSEKLGPN